VAPIHPSLSRAGASPRPIPSFHMVLQKVGAGTKLQFSDRQLHIPDLEDYGVPDFNVAFKFAPNGAFCPKCIFGRKISDKKKFYRQTKIGGSNCPCLLPRPPLPSFFLISHSFFYLFPFFFCSGDFYFPHICSYRSDAVL